MLERINVNTYLDFIVPKKRAFIRNIFDNAGLENCKEIWTVDNYHESFQLFLQIFLLLNANYTKENGIEDISDDCISQFVLKNCFNSSEDLYLETSNTGIIDIWQKKKQNIVVYKLITLVSWSVINFPKTSSK